MRPPPLQAKNKGRNITRLTSFFRLSPPIFGLKIHLVPNLWPFKPLLFGLKSLSGPQSLAFHPLYLACHPFSLACAVPRFRTYFPFVRTFRPIFLDISGAQSGCIQEQVGRAPDGALFSQSLLKPFLDVRRQEGNVASGAGMKGCPRNGHLDAVLAGPSQVASQFCAFCAAMNAFHSERLPCGHHLDS